MLHPPQPAVFLKEAVGNADAMHSYRSALPYAVSGPVLPVGPLPAVTLQEKVGNAATMMCL